MSEMQLSTAVKSNGHGKALSVYGERDEIKEMEARILAMLPGADKLSQQERRALAQISVAHALNPFNGECWAIPSKGLMIGIKGLRKKAHEAMDAIGGNFWIDYREITDPAERERWGIKPGDLAFEARLYDSANIRTYVDTIKTLMDAKIPWEAVEKMVGTRPYTSGIGVLKAGETTRMERVQCSRKRSEANALKQRFDVPFGVSVVADAEENGEVITGTVVTENQPEEQAPIPTMTNAQLDAEIVESEKTANTRKTLFG